jgi:hypothetical protein
LAGSLKQRFMGQGRAVINLDVNISVMGLASGHGGAMAVLARTPPPMFPISFACIRQALRLCILPAVKESLGSNTESWSRELLIYVKPRDTCGAWRWR